MQRMTIGFLTLVLMLVSSGFASAQSVPSVKGLTAHSAETHFMSLTGFMRWQYFRQNTLWIGYTEAEELVRAQLSGK
jgi:hypothetical protein